VVPARLQRDDVGLALAKRARGASPAAKFDIAGGVEFGRVITDRDLRLPAAILASASRSQARSGAA